MKANKSSLLHVSVNEVNFGLLAKQHRNHYGGGGGGGDDRRRHHHHHLLPHEFLVVQAN